MAEEQPIKTESKTNEAFAVFCGPIDQATTKNFLNGMALASQSNPPLTHLHVLLQSTGGFVSEGVCLYNAIRELPVELTLYNAGGISSIAVIAYLGAKNRKVSQHATFMIHRTTASPQAASSNVLRNVAHSVIIDDERTEAILRKHLNITEEQWSDLRNNEFWFTAGDAVKSGLATSIGDFAPPRGQRVFRLFVRHAQNLLDAVAFVKYIIPTIWVGCGEVKAAQSPVSR